ncbi:hypothetical protein EJB05_53455 [Eragrostis curvula]|uniref:Jasmonate O-methyltransferase n=1 Tax=Eragrostis curvula TaxID=38414 RepID=A0A5J9SQ92_9POAL|nr:hypothetical protein EJB05_53455 [Eragrostis curvula]
MKVEIDLRMATGDGANSYATNSRLQKKAILETKPVLQEAIEELYMSLASRSTMICADLGCSSGPNTLLFVSEVMSAIRNYACDQEMDNRHAVEVQFFLNDLPGNDFNLVFRSLEQLQKYQNHIVGKENPVAPPYYVAGLPGSFYTRLFPGQSVHFFHSSYCLMWRSKVPEDLSSGTYLNDGNIYIGKTTPPIVVKLLQEQFKQDFELFLMLRYTELVCGGRMVLTFLSRKSDEMLMHGDVGRMWELLAEALQSLVQKGIVEKEKLRSFNLPFYAPSVNEVKALIKGQGMFNIEHIRLFESSWDPHDDSDAEAVLDCDQSGESIAKSIRAVIEPLIMDHFGGSIIDDLFLEYASIVANHLKKGKAKYPVVVVSLKKAIH